MLAWSEGNMGITCLHSFPHLIFAGQLCLCNLVRNLGGKLVAKGTSFFIFLLQNRVHMLRDISLYFAGWSVCVYDMEQVAVVVLIAKLLDPPLQAVGSLVESDEPVSEGVHHVVVFGKRSEHFTKRSLVRWRQSVLNVVHLVRLLNIIFAAVSASKTFLNWAVKPNDGVDSAGS